MCWFFHGIDNFGITLDTRNPFLGLMLKLLTVAHLLVVAGINLLRLCVEAYALQVGNGLLADTPGFNVPSLTNLTVSNLQACFPEIDRRLESHR